MNTEIFGTPARIVREEFSGDVPLFVHPEWRDAMPWLAQGITGSPHGSQDMSWFGASPVGELQTRWRMIRDFTSCATSVHARQVHGTAASWHDALPPGVIVQYDVDGHATNTRGILLAVSVADCVPVSIVDPSRRAIAALHAGWRGAAAGMLDAGIAVLRERAACDTADLLIHFGPAICGACYEVGAEVAEAFGVRIEGKAQLDVRGMLTERAIAAGIAFSNITCSAWCTRCGDSPFFSHRAGQPERQMAIMGIRGS